MNPSQVGSGPATLIEEFEQGAEADRFGPTVERITLLWSVPDRVYLLRCGLTVPPAMISAGMAAAVRDAIHLANSIE